MELRVPTAPKIILWHAPGCPQSKRALELLELTDCEVETYDYVTQPPTVEQLRELLGHLGCGPRRLARKKEPAYEELGLDEADDEALIAALCRNPNLLQSPIAVAPEHREAVVGRPPELVLQLLIPKLPAGVNAEELLRQAMQGKLPR
ncbi:MAG: arsenate reductase (glutaredoxin) [Deltaproteobacteria bacterium]|nr:arsenate reductase (glutaredoxin) [Deltaproteobacteria bacterium]MBW2531485.1 arsenate reductase (glutaredoxin) [Deltaproteobacteria bacterium]